jgi:hypothetical protein
LYLQNIKENLTGGPIFAKAFLKPYVFAKWMDTVYLVIHFLFLPFIALIILVKRGALALKVSFLYLFFMLIIISSGISFDEGDRLTVTALPLWLAVYLVVPMFNFCPIFPERQVAE